MRTIQCVSTRWDLDLHRSRLNSVHCTTFFKSQVAKEHTMETAFAQAPLSFRRQTAVGRKRICASRRRELYACAGKSNGVVPPNKSNEAVDDDDYVQTAINSGASIREQLRQAAEDRKEQARRVQTSIAQMNAALDKIMAKLKGQVGNAPTSSSSTTVTPIEESSESLDENDEIDNSTVTSNSYLDSDAEPYMDPSTFGMDSTAGWQVLANRDALPSSNAPVKFRIECDGSGCSIIEMEADAAPGPGVRQQFVHSGRGFRVGYDPEAPDSFCGMVGTDQWLLALDKQELSHFKRLATAVARKMSRIDRGDEQAPGPRATPAVRRSGDGMFNERVVGTDGSGISVEMESKLMWVQAFGQTKLGGYALRVILMERRQSEGYWGADVVPSMLVAIAKLGVE